MRVAVSIYLLISNAAMKQLLAITRTRSRLTATILHTELPDAARLDSPTEADAVVFSAWHTLETCELDDCDVFLTPQHQQLRRSWAALQNVTAPNVETLVHVCIVLLETVAGTEDGKELLPPLEWHRETVAPIRRPTAAHPRAYKGTKTQPPKLSLPDAVDLRPYLYDPQNLRLILMRLRPFWNDAAVQLRRVGYPPQHLKVLGMSEDAPRRTEQNPVEATIDRIVTAEVETGRLPDKFRRVLLLLLQGVERAQVNAYLGLYWKLALASDEAVLSAYANLHHLQKSDVTLRWGEVLARLTAHWRVPFACLLAHTKAYKIDPRGLSSSVLQAFEDMGAQPYPVYRLYCLLLGLARNVDGDYMLAGFELANEYSPKRCFYNVEQSGPYPSEVVAHCIVYMRPPFSATYEDTPLLMWEACGVFPSFGQMLAEAHWSVFASDTARAYVQLLTNGLWQEWTPEQKTDSWKWLWQIKPQIDRLLEQMPPEYQQKCLLMLREFAWEWGETPRTRNRLTTALALMERVCQPPFRKRTGTANIVAILGLHLDEAACRSLLEAPDSSFLRLEEACARENSATLVHAGLETLAAIMPEWMARAFVRHAAKLCRVSRLLGCFSDALRAQFARGFACLPYAQSIFTELNLEDAVAQSELMGAAFGKNLVPSAIRKHVAQHSLISPERLAHYRQEMESRLLLAQLELLEQSAVQAICPGFEGVVGEEKSDEAVFHAMQMRRHISDNRRAFRNFLRAYLNGEKDYLRLHPRSQAWFRRHPGVNEAVWLKGIVVPAAFVEGMGTVRIGMETEPLEALRMGTHVGSCLGLGGDFAYSAVANMLDINKQVLYARNEAGQVVARQLVAVSDAEQLVCFSVYPYGASAALQQCFRDYDTQWADALGMELFRAQSDADYEIANVLSQHWWDDGAWNLEIEEA